MFRRETRGMRLGMDCKAQRAGNVNYLAKRCNTAGRQSRAQAAASRHETGSKDCGTYYNKRQGVEKTCSL